IEHSVLLIPGKVFSRRDTHFRLSYAVSDKTLQAGLEILTRLMKEAIGPWRRKAQPVGMVSRYLRGLSNRDFFCKIAVHLLHYGTALRIVEAGEHGPSQFPNSHFLHAIHPPPIWISFHSAVFSSNRGVPATMSQPTGSPMRWMIMRSVDPVTPSGLPAISTHAS